jgi:nitrate reductase NapE component
MTEFQPKDGKEESDNGGVIPGSMEEDFAVDSARRVLGETWNPEDPKWREAFEAHRLLSEAGVEKPKVDLNKIRQAGADTESRKQQGNALVVVVIILTVAIIGALGYVVWNNFIAQKVNQSTPETSQSEDVECESDVVEKSNTFCSKDIGVTFKVPSIFDGKFEKTDNYEIFSGTVDYTTRVSAGSSDVVYSAAITGNDIFILTIAKEPLRSGYVEVGHMLHSTYYDKETGVLSDATSPSRHYDSMTNTTTTSGEYAIAGTVPSFTSDDVKFYHGTDGDAGVRTETYFAVINGSIVKIKLTNRGYMGPDENDPSTIDADLIFNELEDAMKDLKIIHN